MRWWSWLALVMVACGGDGGTDSGDGGTTDGTNGGDDDDVVIDCESLPVFNLDELDCDGTWSAFLQVASAASPCNSDHDCTVVEPDCQHWVQATCFVAANDCLTTDIMHEFDAAGFGCVGDDSSDICTCTATPDVQCKDHICQFVYE